MASARKQRYCGRIKETEADVPTYDKEFIITPDTRCKVKTDFERATKIQKFTTQDECHFRCSDVKKCKAFQWNGKIKICIIFKYKLSMDIVQAVTSGEDARVCAIVTKNTPSPTQMSTEVETEQETEQETVVECTLRAKLKFDFNEPNDAGTKGYHADYMEVYRDGDGASFCSNGQQNNLPSWCTYKNSDPDGDSAYVANADDEYYEEDELTSETVMILSAAGRTIDVYVSHWFNGKDYYPDEEGWEDDHMLAAVLKIRNMSHGEQKQLSSDGWSHPVDQDTPTHDSNGNQNKDYQGNFKVTVTCDDACYCGAEYMLV